MKLCIEPDGRITVPLVKMASHDGYFRYTLFLFDDDDAQDETEPHSRVPCMVLESSRSTCKEDLPCMDTIDPLRVLIKRPNCDVEISHDAYLDCIIDLYFGYAYNLNAFQARQPEASGRAHAYLASLVNRINDQTDPTDMQACDQAVRAMTYLLRNTGGLYSYRSPRFEYIYRIMDRALEVANERASRLRCMHACASRIQRCYKRAYYDPTYSLCRRRLMRDFASMTQEIRTH